MTIVDFTPWTALLGGLMIGTASAWAMALNGKIPGISGLCARTLLAEPGDTAWRVSFLAGLIGGAGLLFQLIPDTAAFALAPSLGLAGTAGLLVGVGTRVGGGCTSGHGICGIGRGSRRSTVATLVFVATAIITVYLMRHGL
ncbi:MAG TPA: YeeE/YedE family protein [Acidobacteriota bacterium]|nr:YeeE/YedE family protein [Acidobacteriota bacterium]